MKPILCASMMCADFSSLRQEIEVLNDTEIDIFHCDIMDGSFVSNFALGLNDLDIITRYATKQVDVHLMIDNPYHKVDWFLKYDIDIIYIHAEAEKEIIKTLQKIRDAGKKTGLAINPDTSYSQVVEILSYVDYVLIMSVHPGFAGQAFIESVETKICRFIENKYQYNYQIILDGAISPHKVKAYSKLGVDGFVLGTSALFNQASSYKETIDVLKSLEMV